MLKQKARAIALGVLVGDLALTALSLPAAYALRQEALVRLFPLVFPPRIAPISQYWSLLSLILPL